MGYGEDRGQSNTYYSPLSAVGWMSGGEGFLELDSQQPQLVSQQPQKNGMTATPCESQISAPRHKEGITH